MKFRVSVCVFVLLFVLQLSNAEDDENEQDQTLLLNKKIENFIKQILQIIRSYSKEVRGNSNCVSEEVMDSAMATLRRSIDCVESNEREYGRGRISGKVHRKQFLGCFAKAKEEVKNWLRNSTVCPDKLTETTYEINVTTTLTKTFLIRIRNGVNVTDKKFEMSHADEPSPDLEESVWSSPESERNPTSETEVWRGHDATISDDMYIDYNVTQRNEDDESTTKDTTELGKTKEYINRNSTVHTDEEDSDSTEEEDYDSDSF